MVKELGVMREEGELTPCYRYSFPRSSFHYKDTVFTHVSTIGFDLIYASCFSMWQSVCF